MRRPLAPVVGAMLAIAFVTATARRADADVCVSIDETRDTFTPTERTAALLLLTRQFELAGERVVAPGCDTPYVVYHVRLGTTIAVTLSGPNAQRDATAIGLDDIPAVYSQMVRSLLHNRPMGTQENVDRTNVTASQTSARRIYSDSVAYARLGYGGVVGDRLYGGPSVGVFGYRKEFDALAIDVSFLNFLYKSSPGPSYAYPSSGSSGMTGAWLKLEMLRFLTPTAARSTYIGGGLSWSTANLESQSKSWSGDGLQGELTAGYELQRASTVRVFFQADLGLPFYRLRADTYAFQLGQPYPYATGSERRYCPSLSLSMGLGWQRGGGR